MLVLFAPNIDRCAFLHFSCSFDVRSLCCGQNNQVSYIEIYMEKIRDLLDNYHTKVRGSGMNEYPRRVFFFPACRAHNRMPARAAVD